MAQPVSPSTPALPTLCKIPSAFVYFKAPCRHRSSIDLAIASAKGKTFTDSTRPTTVPLQLHNLPQLVHSLVQAQRTHQTRPAVTRRPEACLGIRSRSPRRGGCLGHQRREQLPRLLEVDSLEMLPPIILQLNNQPLEDCLETQLPPSQQREDSLEIPPPSRLNSQPQEVVCLANLLHRPSSQRPELACSVNLLCRHNQRRKQAVYSVNPQRQTHNPRQEAVSLGNRKPSQLALVSCMLISHLLSSTPSGLQDANFQQRPVPSPTKHDSANPWPVNHQPSLGCSDQLGQHPSTNSIRRPCQARTR